MEESADLMDRGVSEVDGGRVTELVEGQRWRYDHLISFLSVGVFVSLHISQYPFMLHIASSSLKGTLNFIMDAADEGGVSDSQHCCIFPSS